MKLIMEHCSIIIHLNPSEICVKVAGVLTFKYKISFSLTDQNHYICFILATLLTHGVTYL